MADQRLFRLVFDPRGPLRQAAFHCEADIFLRSYGVSRSDHVAEFEPYEDSSVFVAVLDSLNSPVGVMRLIGPNPIGLKTVNEAAGAPWSIDADRALRAAGVDDEQTWDVATLGVPVGIGSRRFMVTAALYHALFLASRENGMRSLVMNLDERVRAILTMAGLVTHALPGVQPKPFCGSAASTPVYAHLGPMLDNQRRINPEAHRLMVRGVGLDGITMPSAVDFQLNRPRVLRAVELDAALSA